MRAKTTENATASRRRQQPNEGGGPRPTRTRGTTAPTLASLSSSSSSPPPPPPPYAAASASSAAAAAAVAVVPPAVGARRSSEEAFEAAVAVGLVALLFERSLLQLLLTVRAHEARRVELAEHGRNAPSCRQEQKRRKKTTKFNDSTTVPVYLHTSKEEAE